MEYDDSNRAFVQAFLARSVLTLKEAQPILAGIFSISEGRKVRPIDVTEDDFNSMISTATQALSPLDFEIRSAIHQTSRERFYALVNTSSDGLTQLATVYNADEMAYVKRFLDELFEVNNTERREAMCISSKDAINLARAGRRETQGEEPLIKFNLTGHEVERLLTYLVADGWLEKSAASFYSLSPRALMELKDWLSETYNDPIEEDEEPQYQKIKFCHACRDIVTTGQRCPQRECRCRIHDICTQNFFRVQRARTCPLCRTDWDGKHFVGERAITTSEAYLRGKRRSGATVRTPEPQSAPEAEGAGSE